MIREKILTSILGALLLFFLVPSYASAAALFMRSDTLGSSAPGANVSHILQFTTNTAVPPSGAIVYTPEDGEFDIPAGMSYLDIDFMLATTAPSTYANRLVGTTTSSTTDDVNITSGTSGNITIKLNTDTGIPANTPVRILVGDIALDAATGTIGITNPSATTTYEISFTTLDAGDVLIDGGVTAIIIVDQVSVGPVDTTETDPPERSNGAPQGEIANLTTSVEVSLNTNEFSECRYSTSAGVLYSAMTNVFPTTGVISHSGLIVSGLTLGTTYSYYVRCSDDEGNENIDDYLIEFFLGPPPGDGGSGPGGGGGSGGGSGGDTGGGSSGGGGGGGGGAPFPPDGAAVTFEGIAFPLSTLYILQDGTITRTLTLGSDGAFDTTVSNIPPGTYTFGIYASDAEGVKSSTFNSTFSLVGGTGNTLSDIFLSPTLVLDSERVEPGGILGISGTSIANTTVEIWTHQQKSPILDSEITKIFAGTDDEGRWSSVINTTGFLRDTYQIQIRALFENGDDSFFSDFQFYGVGVDAEPINLLSADLNRDGFVNIIDFSILLFHWGTTGGAADPPPDINQDGTVSLTDFSIMLFQWTG